MFKRRTPRSYFQVVTDFVYPRGGWTRAARYVGHRLHRLPDPAYKISRGIACGVFVCFTPFFGLHFLMSAALAWLIRGNVVAALLATFFGNPLTFPFIAGISVELGQFMLGYDEPLPLPRIFGAFSNASVEMWQNVHAIFTPEPTHWERLGDFVVQVLLPYTVGGLIPGLIAAGISYAASRPLIGAYQKARIHRMKKNFAKRRVKADAALKAD
ncbi:DUF2062 domain-containing protein [Tranquillimonas alkanivorans]|uniref:DUF2062 domain-containing protein n=1 Tax=Tranquillimonas alkanivorans TaxID=441119 RepID=A0A1I5KCZ3_9RHOB|nr:DUF2062 domain-containing protein [Tranquillimonas alkanivorans]SFO82889.1 hypothetical protein SAMN04488047_10130 [Tranquillimonas alkanivorans]